MDFATILLLTQSPEQIMGLIQSDVPNYKRMKTNFQSPQFHLHDKKFRRQSNQKMRAFHQVKQPRGINH